MIKIYEINNKEVPSKEYVDAMIKNVNDKLITHENNNNAHDNILNKKECTDVNVPFEYAELDVNSQKDENISPESISTDSNNRFVSEQEMMSLKNRPTTFEIDKKINSIKEELFKEINNKFNTLLNTPNSLEKIKILVNLLSEEDDLDTLISTIVNINADNIVKHESNNMHLTDNDRKALNVLIDLCRDGFADWDAKDGAINSISNKPKNIENAKSILGYGLDFLLNKQPYDLIIGTDNINTDCNIYNSEECNIYLSNKELYDSYSKFYDILKDFNGSIMFRNGTYLFNEITFDRCNIQGSSDTNIDGEIIFNKCTIRDINFYDSTITINSDVSIENCTFSNCDIVFSDTLFSNISHCKFFNSTSYVRGNTNNNFITYNIFNRSQISLLGFNNIMRDNITY